MGISERREREREEVRKKILDSARELFASEGYDKVTMRRIAEAIEYSPTAIYHHFEDKDDLVESLCREDFTRLLGALSLQELPADPIEWIRQLGRAYAAFGLTYPNHYRFMFMSAGKFEDIEHDPEMPGKQAFAVLEGAVRKAIDAGAFRPGDPLTMAQVLWSNLHGVVALLITLPPEFWPAGAAAPDLVDQVIENGIRGFVSSSGEKE